MRLKTYHDIFQFAIRNKGLTFNLRTGKTCQYKTGFYVSLKNCERVTSFASFWSEDIQKFVTDNLFSLLDSNSFLGIWFDGCKVYLDISVHVKGIYDAVQLAKKNNQKAIWDIENRQSIKI